MVTGTLAHVKGGLLALPQINLWERERFKTKELHQKRGEILAGVSEIYKAS